MQRLTFYILFGQPFGPLFLVHRPFSFENDMDIHAPGLKFEFPPPPPRPLLFLDSWSLL